MLAGTLLAQSGVVRITKTFIVNGRAVAVDAIQVNGRSYVNITNLPQITSGAMSVEPNRIVLTIPGSSAPAALPPVPAAAPVDQGQILSKGFVSTAIAELAEMREWRGTIATMTTYGLAINGAWSQGYHDRVDAGFRQAAAAASTQADQNALGLLRSEFDKLAAWSGQVVADRQALNGEKTVDPNALSNDPDLAKITACGQFLNSMLLGGTFDDGPSCH